MTATHAAAPAAPDADGVMPGTAAYRRIAVALFLAGFSTFSLLYCVQPLLPEFAREFAVSPAESSLALSLSTALLALAIVCAGVLSERLGRRAPMCISLIVAALLNIAAALMPNWYGLLAARALEGLALGGVPAVAMAYLAEEIHPRGLGYAMGLYVGGTAFGGMMGRVGMSLLGEFLSWQQAMAAIGAIDLAAAIAFVLLLPRSRRFVRKAGRGASHHLALWRGHLAHPLLPSVFAVGCVVMGVFVTVYNYAGFRLAAPPYALSPTQSGYIFSAYLLGIVASSVAGALADRYGPGRVLTAGLATAAAGVLLSAGSPLAMVVAGIVVLTIGFFITHSVASGWVGKLATGAKGYAASLYLLAYYLGSSVLGSAGGWFWQHGAWPAVTGYALVLLGIGLLLALRLTAAAARPQTAACHRTVASSR